MGLRPMASSCRRNEKRANARLIAAAPDLYQALDELLRCATFDCSLSPEFDYVVEARAVLAKALGETA